MNSKSHFLLFLLFLSCSGGKRENSFTLVNTQTSPEKVLVIINNSTDSPISLELLDSTFHLKEYWLTSYKTTDSLSIILNQSARVVIHSLVKYPETRFISPGDTLKIDLTSSQLHVESTDKLHAQRIIEERSEYQLEIDSLYDLFIAADSSLAMRGGDDLSLRLSIPVFGNEKLVQENPTLLDSLVNRLVEQLEFVPASLNETANPEFEALQEFKAEIYRHEAFIRLRLLASQLERPVIHEKLFDSQVYQTDLYINSPFAYSYLVFFIKEYVLEGVEDRSSNKAYVDYKLAYDRLAKYLDGDLLKRTREICLEKMVIYNESNLNVRNYIAKYLVDHKDSVFVRNFKNRFLLSYEDQISTSKDLLLLSNSGSTIKLSELVKSNSNDSTTLFYLDFWASWCGPCRKAMPASEEKRALLKNNGVKFIYLSMDRDKQKWETVSISHGLQLYENSYLLINPEEQQFIKDLEIDFIPRYIILNSEGKVIESTAPGPEGEQLKEVLLDYLKK